MPRRRRARRAAGFVLAGIFLVLMSNPKALLLVRRFHPAVRRSQAAITSDRSLLLGVTAMAAAAISDGGYAVWPAALGGCCRAAAFCWCRGSAAFV